MFYRRKRKTRTIGNPKVREKLRAYLLIIFISQFYLLTNYLF